MKKSGALGGWLIFVRSIQLLLGLGALGIASFFLATSATSDSPIPPLFTYFVGAAAATVGWVIVSLVFYCANGLRPVLVVIVDTVVLAMWVVAIALDLRDRAFMLTMSCTAYAYNQFDYFDIFYDSLDFIFCHLWKALFGITAAQIALLITTIILAFAAWVGRRKGPTSAPVPGYIGAIPPGGPGVYSPQGNHQHPHYGQYHSAAPPAHQRYPYQPPQAPQRAYGPDGGARFSYLPPPDHKNGR